MYGKIFVLCSAVILTKAAVPLEPCKDPDVWSSALRDYIFMPEDSISQRVNEWSSLCESLPNKTESYQAEMLRTLWQEYTTFVPLGECSCLKTGSSSREVIDEIPASLFVDYPVLGVILVVVLYLLRIYYARARTGTAVHERHFHHAGDDCDRGTELLR